MNNKKLNLRFHFLDISVALKGVNLVLEGDNVSNSIKESSHETNSSLPVLERVIPIKSINENNDDEKDNYNSSITQHYTRTRLERISVKPKRFVATVLIGFLSS